jgi:hypothetical protein
MTFLRSHDCPAGQKSQYNTTHTSSLPMNTTGSRPTRSSRHPDMQSRKQRKKEIYESLHLATITDAEDRPEKPQVGAFMISKKLRHIGAGYSKTLGIEESVLGDRSTCSRAAEEASSEALCIDQVGVEKVKFWIVGGLEWDLSWGGAAGHFLLFLKLFTPCFDGDSHANLGLLLRGISQS